MLDVICRDLLSVDEFIDLSPQDVRLEPLQTLAHSAVYRIRVDSPEARLILKTSAAADGGALAERERRFYRHIAPRLPTGLVPECVLIVKDRLYIRDLSGSHQAAHGDAPSRPQCRSFVAALGTLHGSTARKPDVLNSWAALSADLPAGTLAQRLRFFQTALSPFMAVVRDRVDPNTGRFLANLASLDRRLQPLTSRADVLVHGDAHFGNALFSEESGACLIDWGMPMIGFGEIDLAHALALNLPTPLRRDWGEEMMAIYLDRLTACGTPLERAVFDERYRLGVLYSFVSPVVWWRSGLPESQWRPALTNALAAARDLGLVG